MTQIDYIERMIGNFLGQTKEVDLDVGEVEWDKYMRVRVKLDILKPLVKKKKLTIKGMKSVWIQLSYKRLPNYCFYCGIISHDYRECTHEKDQKDKEIESALLYGHWLRANLQGSRWIKAQAKKKVDNTPFQSQT